MAILKFSSAGYSLAIAIGIFALAGGASAAPGSIDQSKVQSLATQIETVLQPLGCASTFQQDKAAIQSTIAASGLPPADAEAALARVQAWGGLCPAAAVAVAAVNNTIEYALAGYPGGPAYGASGGPIGAPAGGGPATGGVPIGAPAVFFSGGGSNYRAP